MTTTRIPDVLLVTDRCDRCGARAAVRVCLETGELLFCQHHARAYGFAAEVATSDG